jgi:apolipoprotein N-acyltransferase
MVHLALAQLRAVEHRRYLVRATNSGISAFVDPVGRATGLTPLMEPATRVGTVRWMRARTVYERIGDAPWWCAAAIVLAMALVARPRPR